MLANSLRFLVVICLLLIQESEVLAAPKEFPARVVRTEFGRLAKLQLKEKPPLQNMTVLLDGKRVGELIQPQLSGGLLVGFFEPIPGFEIKRGMPVVLLASANPARTDTFLTLRVTALVGNEVELSGGKADGARVGDRFSLRGKGGSRVGEIRIVHVDEEKSLGNVVRWYGDAQASMTAMRIPPMLQLPERFQPVGKNYSQTEATPGGIGERQFPDTHTAVADLLAEITSIEPPEAQASLPVVPKEDYTGSHS